ncbi:hypothetical protein HNR46_004108 [Haloferula luteola]|uniref:Uncharacterized protein n=1 Tax=Haloferula luteola TaxID=595692 RepID=A0A840VEB4_9BACT|nr:hypothetical protein [Haloferula luteola]MBB5353844.1 hypothetical protein [Haloferula luteola]
MNRTDLKRKASVFGDFLVRLIQAYPRWFASILSVVVCSGAVWNYLQAHPRGPRPNPLMQAHYEREAVSKHARAQRQFAGNQRAIQEFDEAYEVAKLVVHGQSADDTVIRFIAAVDKTNWRECSSDLRSAAEAVGNIKNGDTNAYVGQTLEALLKLCDRYR